MTIRSGALGVKIMIRYVGVVVLFLAMVLIACGGGESVGVEALPAETVVPTITPMGTLTVPP